MVNTKCFNPHTEQLNKINNQIDKLRDEEKELQVEHGHRISQKNAYESLKRAYGSQHCAGKGSGKYWSFAGRKISCGASLGEHRTAIHYLENVIPPEFEKIRKKHNQIKLDLHVLISKARQLNTKAVQHEVDCLKEQQKKTKVKLKNSLLRWVDIGVMT